MTHARWQARGRGGRWMHGKAPRGGAGKRYERMRTRRHESGAAMVIAIAIMTILLAIALTFFTVSRMEVQTATNVTNSVRADQLTNGAVNIAIAHLNQEFFHHPNVTSTDHGWRSVFNGAWVVGKPWALRGGRPLQDGGVPYVDLNQLPFQALVDAGIPQPLYVEYVENGYAQRERLYQGQYTKEWLNYPRVEMLDGRPVLYDPNALLLDRNGNPVPEGLYFRYDPSLTEPDPNSNRRPPAFFPFVTSDFYGVVRRSDGVTTAFAIAPGSPENDPARGGDGGAQYPAEQIHAWTDVDNDGDGLRDSIWVPIPGDVFAPGDGVDNNLNGLIDEQQDNGLNEDGDYCGDGCPDLSYVMAAGGNWLAEYYDNENPKHDPDEAIEPAVFIYWGGDDGLDNDGNGLLDQGDPGENKYFLTAPLPGIEIPVDFNADGVPGDLVLDENGNLVPLKVLLPDRIKVNLPGQEFLTAADVDRLDNDLDLILNDFFCYAYVGPNTAGGPPFILSGFERDGFNKGAPISDSTKVNSYINATGAGLGDYYGESWRLPGNWFIGSDPALGLLRDEDLFAAARSKAYLDINLEAVLQDTTGLRFVPPTGLYTSATGQITSFDYAALIAPYIRITHSGEPVCELVGRAAILITDEASKLNVNVAGGHHFAEGQPGTDWAAPVFRAINEGRNPSEIDTRALTAMGVVRTRNLWTQLTGMPRKNGAIQAGDAALEIAYRYDAVLPGYGRVDDNGNALLLCMNGLDDDGDGLIDEGLNPAYPLLLGQFEGIDEPGEVQWFRPLRNEIAERDGLDNDGDGVTDEIGELGDRLFQNTTQVQEAAEIAEGTYSQINRFITAYSTDRNVVYADTAKGLRALSRLDFNYATPQQNAAALIITGNLEPVTDSGALRTDSADPVVYRMQRAITDFAEGLRQGDTHFSAPVFSDGSRTYGGFLHYPAGSAGAEPATNGPQHALPADPQLQALQLAVNLADSRDADYARSILTTERADLITAANETPAILPATLPVGAVDWELRPWPESLNLRERIAPEALMPMEEIEEYLRRTLNRDGQRTQIIDAWWANLVTADIPDTPEEEKQERHISYSASGTEAIRINELMVRAVRRVEAETVKTGDADYLPNLDPAPYNGLPGFYIARNIFENPFGVDGWVRADLNNSAGVPYDPNAVALLGSRTGWMTNTDLDDLSVVQSTETHPNIIEFQFRATEGLPPGRYYLTVNFTDASGAMTLTDPGDLQYAVKYIDSAATPAMPTIIDDVEENALKAAESGPIDLAEVFINYYFENLGAYRGATASAIAAFLGRRPSGVPGVDGDLTGWAFLPATRDRGSETPPQPLIDQGSVLDPADDTYFLDGLRPESQPYTFPTGTKPEYQTFTITIPDPDVDPYDTVCIAFRKTLNGPNPDDPLSINFFDFSQEPDHEWVELVNVSDHEVNIAGWQLEIGIPKVLNGPDDPFRSLWTVDDANGPVWIAPGGMVLLSFENEPGTAVKYDQYREMPYNETDPLQTPLFKRTLLNTNGIGLCAGGGDPFDADNANDTPGIPDIQNVSAPWIPGWGGYTARTEPELFDPTGSVFTRVFDPDEPLSYKDFVDRDGDGLTSAYYNLNDKTLDTDNVNAETLPATVALPGEEPPLGAGLEPYWNMDGALPPAEQLGGRPWDRIVPMRNEQLWKNGATAMTIQQMKDEGFVGELARLVLQGGVLPNTPEQDGFDNDGDGGYVLNGLYVPGTLDKDYVDNDLDGFIDEHPVYDANGTPADDTDDIPANPLMSEGVDEGRGLGLGLGRLDGAGSYEPGTLPLVFFNDQNEYPPELDFENFASNTLLAEVLGVTSLAVGIWGVSGSDADNANLVTRIGNDYEDAAAAVPMDLTEHALYPGLDDLNNYPNQADPPEWKAFVERRWYPGDNVLVTLYAGTAAEAQVADRVTYRELDVTNRTIDDVVPCPYINPATGDTESIHPDFASFWPPDQMGLDFYRSLERKHPLYAGDRFGTQNRWQATDGNYDDWAESLSVFEQMLNADGDRPVLAQASLSNGNVGPVISRFIDSPNFHETRLMQHALAGSPLRMNLSQRRIENPPDLLKLIAPPVPIDKRGLAQFPALGRLEMLGGNVLLNRDWSWRKVQHTDRPFRGAGDLLSFPSAVRRQPMVNTALGAASPEDTFLFDVSRVNIAFYTTITQDGYCQQDTAFAGGLLGQDSADMPGAADLLEAAQAIMAANPMVLTVAQADFMPIRPNPNETGVYPAGTNFQTLLQASAALAPAAWAPVFLFGLDTDPAAPASLERLPHYPSYPDGSNAGVFINLGAAGVDALFDRAFLFKTGAPFGANDLPLATLPPRWPLERRVTMYWSQHNTALGDQNRPEALFTWDAADGLENGEYMVYIGTSPLALGTALAEANAAALNASGQDILTDFARDVVLPIYNNPNFGLDSELALEIITDPTKARGFAPKGSGGSMPGLAHPDDWMHSPMTTESGIVSAGVEEIGIYKPSADGTIFYGNNASGGWQPRMIQVTDNFLAIRVRNVGDDVSAITHVVLTPRKRMPGKININTATMARSVIGADAEIYNPLLAAPGVVDALATVIPYPTASNPNPVPLGGLISPLENVGLLGAPVPAGDPSNPWPSPEAVAGVPVPPSLMPQHEDVDDKNQYLLANNANQGPLAAFQLSAMMIAGRREHADGRYYANLAELISETSQKNYTRWDLSDTGPLFPLSNETDDDRRHAEVAARFGRLANSLTVRSDVFEIVATVQSGYGVDLDGDGWINYRSNDEFVATAETKGRAVYERRAPSDRSEEPVE